MPRVLWITPFLTLHVKCLCIPHNHSNGKYTSEVNLVYSKAIIVVEGVTDE